MKNNIYNGVHFGPAGQAESFAKLGYKNMLQVPEYLDRFGLNAFEIQCGHGVWLKPEKAELLKKAAEPYAITFSIHAPYYISMSSMDEDKRIGSVRYILQCCDAMRCFGKARIIFHAGSCGKQTREQALEKALDTMSLMVKAVDEAGYEEMTLCPETMGKIGQLGTLEEVLALCSVDKRITPCIDFGHLNARTQGGLASRDDFFRIFDTVSDSLKDERAKTFHSHFSRIEFSAGGEKRHRTFADTMWGPDPDQFVECISKKNITPIVICESAGTQTEDAQYMKRLYEQKGLGLP